MLQWHWLLRLSQCLLQLLGLEGLMDYGAVLRALDELEDDVPLMLEHLASEAEYDQAAGHVRRMAAEAGVRL